VGTVKQTVPVSILEFCEILELVTQVFLSSLRFMRRRKHGESNIYIIIILGSPIMYVESSVPHYAAVAHYLTSGYFIYSICR